MLTSEDKNELNMKWMFCRHNMETVPFVVNILAQNPNKEFSFLWKIKAHLLYITRIKH